MPTPEELARADMSRQLPEWGLVVLGYHAAESQLAGDSQLAPHA